MCPLNISDVPPPARPRAERVRAAVLDLLPLHLQPHAVVERDHQLGHPLLVAREAVHADHPRRGLDEPVAVDVHSTGSPAAAHARSRRRDRRRRRRGRRASRRRGRRVALRADEHEPLSGSSGSRQPTSGRHATRAPSAERASTRDDAVRSRSSSCADRRAGCRRRRPPRRACTARCGRAPQRAFGRSRGSAAAPARRRAGSARAGWRPRARA